MLEYMWHCIAPMSDVMRGDPDPKAWRHTCSMLALAHDKDFVRRTSMAMETRLPVPAHVLMD
jgi:hypothetical protein